MPRRELRQPRQVVDWLVDWGSRLSEPGEMVLIGSAGLLWHAHRIGREEELSEGSMDVDPVTDSEEVAELCYDGLIGSEFEQVRGWHVNLMPHFALKGLPDGWEGRASSETYGKLTVVVPSPEDLLVPKLVRGEPRDLSHLEFARSIGLVGNE
jgi:hypothetical protein